MKNLEEVLKLHKMWLKNEKGGVRANLEGANLRNADLEGANLEGANLPIFCKWGLSIIDDKIQIGCEERTIKEWDKFFASDEVIETERNTEDFKRIEAVYLAYKAYYEHLKK